jgi:hypothetical protein
VNKARAEADARPSPVNMQELQQQLEGKSEEERLEYVLQNVMKNLTPAQKEQIRRHYRNNIKKSESITPG